jgi:hypothetical protein
LRVYRLLTYIGHLLRRDYIEIYRLKIAILELDAHLLQLAHYITLHALGILPFNDDTR